MSTVIKYLHFRDIINQMCAIREDEVTLHFKTDGIIVKFVDLANVALVNLTIPTSVFECYDLTEQDIVIKLENLRTSANLTYGFVTISQIADENKTLTMLKFESGKYSSVFKHDADAVVKKEPNEPTMIWTSKTIIKASDMRKFLTKTSPYYDKIRVHIQNNHSHFYVSNDHDKLTFEIDNGMITVDNNSSLYNMDYMKRLFKHLKGDVEFSSGNDMPCKISIQVGGCEIGYYMLAPRIESD